MTVNQLTPQEPKAPTAIAEVVSVPMEPARNARLQSRHYGVVVSFFLLVVAPVGLAAYYLYEIAADQFSSRVSFSIRSEEFENPLDALSSFGQISTGTSSDASILNEYLRSQKLIEDLEVKVDLRAIYSKPDYDPVFAFDPEEPIEDLLEYWQDMTYVSYDPGNGLIDVEAFAFSAIDAHSIATAVMEASSELVDDLSRIAKDDTTKDAAFELEKARERLTETRLALRNLRDKEQIVDPTADLQSQMGVLTALQQQLATSIIEYDLLAGTTRVGDPRLERIQSTIDAIQNRISQERNKISTDQGSDQQALATIVGEFETLIAEREFAEQVFMAASANYDAALAEARRKSRYLAAHVPPTMAESSKYPQKELLLLGVFGAVFVSWMILTLSAYAIADRR